MIAACCFCGKSITEKIFHVKVIDWKTKSEPFGNYFCHLDCFKKLMNKGIKKYTLAEK